MEPYPIVSPSGKIVGYVLSSSDITIVYDARGRPARRILWFSEHEGAVVDPIIRGNRFIETPSGHVIDLFRWVEEMPIQPYYTYESLEDYVGSLTRLSEELRGKKVLVEFSGGKDSFAALLVLSKLSELIGFKLIAVYSHMPVFESYWNVYIARRITRKLGVELIETKPDLPVLRKYIYKEGLPYRGLRWCTYLKVRPIRRIKKELNVDYTVSGDRLAETVKRLQRLINIALKGKLVSGKQLRPTYTWTLLDVIRACRLANYVHPDYLRGLPRVSCSYCPYKSLHEFSATRKTGHEWLVEDVLRREYRRWYEGKAIDWESFKNRHLWRYPPKAARVWNNAMNYVERLADRGELEVVKADKVHELYRSSWVHELPKLPVKSLEEELEDIKRWISRNTEKFRVEAPRSI